MRTFPLKALYEAIVRMRGLDPATAGMTTAEKGVIAELVNDRLREAWGYAFWPETLVVEQRTYRAAWRSGANYEAGAEVFHEDAYWVASQTSVNQEPAEGSAYWTASGASGERTMRCSIAYEQVDETVIWRADALACVFASDPRLTPELKPVRPVTLLADEIVVLASPAPMKPFVRFQAPPPEVTLTEWDAGVTYAIGDLAYRASTGHSYKALAATTNETPEGFPAVWEAVGIPDFLRTFLKHAVRSDQMEEEDGKWRERSRADEELERLASALLVNQGMNRRARR